MNVEVHDRHALDPKIGLCMAGCDRDVVEDAESHRAPLESVVPRRPDERESFLLDRAKRTARSELGRLPGRGVRVRVRQKPGLGLDRLDRVQVLRSVNAFDRLPRRRSAFDESREGAEQPDDSLGVFVVEVALGGVQLRQRVVADQVDVRVSSNLPASPIIPSTRACSAAALQSGSTSGSAGIGAERSSVAISR